MSNHIKLVTLFVVLSLENLLMIEFYSEPFLISCMACLAILIKFFEIHS